MNTAQQIQEVCNEVAQLLINKNNSYGDSALNPIRVFSRSDPIQGLLIRIDDKLSRLKDGNGSFNEDTEFDLLGYLILLRVARKRAALDVGEEAVESKDSSPVPPKPRSTIKLPATKQKDHPDDELAGL